MKSDVGRNDVNVFGIVNTKVLVQFCNAKPVDLLNQGNNVENAIIVQFGSPRFRCLSSVCVFMPTNSLAQITIGGDFCFPRSKVFGETRIKPR